mmetsp:Transcript_19114/g.47532  ORF Transcript_19114/g.47532 Transcript_19114/m.47532 type:complete len:276 (-) Transcript_19114:277-1104(-)
MGEWLRSGDGSCRGRPAPLLGLFARNQAVVGLIDFVAHHHKRKLRRGVTQSLDSTADLVQKLFSPVIQIVERVGIRHVVYQQAGIRTPIKSHTQRLKALLAGRVPNLQGHQMSLAEKVVVDNDIVLGQKIGPNGGLVLAREFSCRESIHQGCLSDPRVAQNDNFQRLLVTVVAGSAICVGIVVCRLVVGTGSAGSSAVCILLVVWIIAVCILVVRIVVIICIVVIVCVLVVRVLVVRILVAVVVVRIIVVIVRHDALFLILVLFRFEFSSLLSNL